MACRELLWKQERKLKVSKQGALDAMPIRHRAKLRQHILHGVVIAAALERERRAGRLAVTALLGLRSAALAGALRFRWREQVEHQQG